MNDSTHSNVPRRRVILGHTVVAVLAFVAAFVLFTAATAGFDGPNGTSVGDVAASNTDLTIFEGAGKAYAFGNTFEPRVWNGTINYTATSQIPVPAALPLSMAGLGALALMRRFRRA